MVAGLWPPHKSFAGFYVKSWIHGLATPGFYGLWRSLKGWLLQRRGAHWACRHLKPLLAGKGTQRP